MLRIECEAKMGDYEAKVSVGDRGTPRWLIRLTFADLRYERSPRYP